MCAILLLGVSSDDYDGTSADMGHFVTRCFRQADKLYLWVLNNQRTMDVPTQRIHLFAGAIPGNACYTRWTETGSYDSLLPLTPTGSVELAFPRRSFTLIELPFEPEFRVLTVDRLTGDQLPGYRYNVHG